MKRILAGFLVVAMLATATGVFAFGPGIRERGFGPAVKDVYAPLNLTSEQTEKMWHLKDRFYAETSGIRYQMLQKRIELHDLYGDPKANDATIMAKQKELNALRTKYSEKKAEFMIGLRHILTPEQIEKYNELYRGHGFGRGHGRR